MRHPFLCASHTPAGSRSRCLPPSQDFLPSRAQAGDLLIRLLISVIGLKEHKVKPEILSVVIMVTDVPNGTLSVGEERFFFHHFLLTKCVQQTRCPVGR